MRCGKADTDPPRSRVQLNSAFPRSSCGRSTLFLSTRSRQISYLVPLPQQAYREEALSDGQCVATHASPAFEGVYEYWVCRPSSLSCARPHLRNAPSATVEQQKRDTARLASGNSTTFGQINRTITPPNADESQLSSSRTDSELPVPLGLRQRPSGAARTSSDHFSPMRDGATTPAPMGPDSSRAPGTQCSQNSRLPPLQVITDCSAPSVFDFTLEYSKEQVVLFWQPPSYFRSGPYRRLSWTTYRILARSNL